MFVKKPRSSDAYEGDTVIIHCEVIGDPKPDVVWLRDFLRVSFPSLYIFSIKCEFYFLLRCSKYYLNNSGLDSEVKILFK